MNIAPTVMVPAAKGRLGTLSAYYTGRDVEEVRALRSVVGRVTLQGDGGLIVLSALERAGDVHNVDLDPAQYVAKDRPAGLFDLDWQGRQADLALRVIRSEGTFVPRGDKAALRAALSCKIRPGTTRVISLHSGWLHREHGIALRAGLLACDSPLGIVLAAPFDPLNGKDALAVYRDILAALVAAEQIVETIRGDLSGLGFLTDGVAGAAIGVTAAGRHHGLGMGGRARMKYDERQTTPTVFLPRLASWHHGRPLLEALAPFGGDRVAEPDCSVCGDRSLLRFAQAYPRAVPLAIAAEARAHDVQTWRAIATQVFNAPNPVKAWTDMAHAAQREALRLTAERKIPIRLPKYLTAWAPLPD